MEIQNPLDFVVFNIHSSEPLTAGWSSGVWISQASSCYLNWSSHELGKLHLKFVSFSFYPAYFCIDNPVKKSAAATSSYFRMVLFKQAFEAGRRDPEVYCSKEAGPLAHPGLAPKDASCFHPMLLLPDFPLINLSLCMLKRCFVFLFNAWDNIQFFCCLSWWFILQLLQRPSGSLGLITPLVLARLVKAKEKPCCETHIKIELLGVSKHVILTFLLDLA